MLVKSQNGSSMGSQQGLSMGSQQGPGPEGGSVGQSPVDRERRRSSLGVGAGAGVGAGLSLSSVNTAASVLSLEPVSE